MNLDFPVGWSLRAFYLELGLFFIVFGLSWVTGLPRFGSRWGMLFKVALESEENWRLLHKRIGMLFILSGAVLMIPFPSLALTLKIQIPMVLGLLGCGIVAIKSRMERKKESLRGR